jgi:uncharacterized protein (DUF1810 family)
VTSVPFDLDRFVDAQARGGGYQTALAELRAGRKVSHWIWWVFPQVAGLGASPTSQLYAISSLDEARAFARHPLLGARLREATAAMLGHAGESAGSILGGDDIKFRSSMTLFMRADPEEPLFRHAIDTFFGGRPDPLTDERLGVKRGAGRRNLRSLDP